MDLYNGSLQSYAHLEEMRMVCNTFAPPELQGMEYPSPGPETPPWEGNCQSYERCKRIIFVCSLLWIIRSADTYIIVQFRICSQKNKMWRARENETLPFRYYSNSVTDIQQLHSYSIR